MQITGTDLGPADLFMLGDWINQVRAYAAAAQYKGNQE
jgi:hypothetical protein